MAPSWWRAIMLAVASLPVYTAIVVTLTLLAVLVTR